MSIFHGISLGLTGDRISRTVVGRRVSKRRSLLSTGLGGALGAMGTGAVSSGAAALGLTGLAAAAAPVVGPVAVVAGLVAFVRSRQD